MSNINLHLVKILTGKRGETISGERISRKLGVTRTAIWKHINELRGKGYIIASSPGCGYKLISRPEDIVVEEILAGLNTEFVGQEINYYPELKSTNEKAKELAADGAANGQVVITERQKQGKGRLGRNWYSPRGTGLWFSVILRPGFQSSAAPLLTVVACLAVDETLRKLGFAPDVKWPNDIFLAGKKVCGILSEMNADLELINYAIVGVGLNVNQREFPGELKEIATSLRLAGGNKINRNRCLQSVLSAFEKYYFLLQQGQRTELIDLWRGKLDIIGKTVNLRSGGEVYSGTAVGISDTGKLVLEDNGGNLLTFWAGDASTLD